MRYLIAWALLLCGCSSVTLTPGAKNIRIVEHKQDLDKRCKVTGQLEASASQFGSPEYLVLHDDDAKKKLLNMAAERGDTVYIYEADSGLFGSKYKAYVLRCNEVKAETGPPAVPVTAPYAAPLSPASPSPASITEPAAAEALPEQPSQPLPEPSTVAD